MAKKTHKRGGLGDIATVVGSSANAAEAAKRLGVNRSTVLRWIAKGQAPEPGSRLPAIGTEVAEADPKGWAATVRETFAHDPTSLELLGLAEQALNLAKDPETAPTTSLIAMGRFQALVKQLLAASGELVRMPQPTRSVTDPRSLRGIHSDPRSLLMAVK